MRNREIEMRGMKIKKLTKRQREMKKGRRIEVERKTVMEGRKEGSERRKGEMEKEGS